MRIELFQKNTFSEYLNMKLPQRLEDIYIEIRQQKKLKYHEITLIFNGNVLPSKGNCSDYQLKETSTIRIVLPIPIVLKSLTPNEGTSFGGTTVVIDGYFPYRNRRYKVVFGVTEVFVDFYSLDKLKVITPAHQPGVVNVTVCYEGGEPSNPLLFTFYHVDGFRRLGGRCGNAPTVDLEDVLQNPII